MSEVVFRRGDYVEYTGASDFKRGSPSFHEGIIVDLGTNFDDGVTATIIRCFGDKTWWNSSVQYLKHATFDPTGNMISSVSVVNEPEIHVIWGHAK